MEVTTQKNDQTNAISLLKLVICARIWERCIVHTSDFQYWEIYANHNEWYTELKFIGKTEQ